MINWKEQLHLFANGSFRIKYSESEPIPLNYVILYRLCKRPHLRNVKLIARPITDMADKEWRSIVGYSKNGLRESIRNDDLKFYVVRYLLSIGVYPFDQSHFDDGTVLNINNI